MSIEIGSMSWLFDMGQNRKLADPAKLNDSEEAFYAARDLLANCPHVAAYAIVVLDEKGDPTWSEYSKLGKEGRLLRTLVQVMAHVSEREG